MKLGKILMALLIVAIAILLYMVLNARKPDGEPLFNTGLETAAAIESSAPDAAAPLEETVVAPYLPPYPVDCTDPSVLANAETAYNGIYAVCEPNYMANCPGVTTLSSDGHSGLTMNDVLQLNRMGAGLECTPIL